VFRLASDSPASTGLFFEGRPVCCSTRPMLPRGDPAGSPGNDAQLDIGAMD
jgi:hypothetical protein